MRVSKCFSKMFLFLVVSVSILNGLDLNYDYNLNQVVISDDNSKPTYNKVRV